VVVSHYLLLSLLAVGPVGLALVGHHYHHHEV